MGGIPKNLAVLLFLVYCSSQVEAQGQGKHYDTMYCVTVRCMHVLIACWSSAGVHLQFKGARVANHDFVTRGDIGIHTNNSLLCVTPNNTNCCSSDETEGAPLGNWYFPNGTEIPTNDTGWLFYITRGPGVVRLNRRTGGVPGDLPLCDTWPEWSQPDPLCWTVCY